MGLGGWRKVMFDRNIDFSKTLWQAFVVDECKLKNLTKLLQKQIGVVNFSVDFVHGVSYRFETLGELIDYENPKSKEIRRISVHATSDDYSKSASVFFHNGIGLPAVAISLKVSQDTLLTLLDEIQDVIRGMRPWYNVLSYLPGVYSCGLALLFAFMGLFRSREYISRIIGTFEFENETGEYLILRLIVMLSAALLWFPFYKMLVFAFPSKFFVIGQGKERFNRLKWFHGFIMTFIISSIFFVMKLVTT